MGMDGLLTLWVYPEGQPTKGTTRPDNADVEGTKKKNPLNNQRVVFSFGAEGETRTPTGEPQLDPEPSASTNSATSARSSLISKRLISN